MESQRTDIFDILRSGVPGYNTVSNAYDDDERFLAGLSRVIYSISVSDEIVAAGGEGTVIDSPRLAAYVFTTTTVIEWTWTPADRPAVTIHPRGNLIAIEIDDAPTDISPRDGRLAYTLVYPWGRVALRERSVNPHPEKAFASFVEDLSRS